MAYSVSPSKSSNFLVVAELKATLFSVCVYATVLSLVRVMEYVMLVNVFDDDALVLSYNAA